MNEAMLKTILVVAGASFLADKFTDIKAVQEIKSDTVRKVLPHVGAGVLAYFGLRYLSK